MFSFLSDWIQSQRITNESSSRLRKVQLGRHLFDDTTPQGLIRPPRKRSKRFHSYFSGRIDSEKASLWKRNDETKVVHELLSFKTIMPAILPSLSRCDCRLIQSDSSTDRSIETQKRQKMKISFPKRLFSWHCLSCFRISLSLSLLLLLLLFDKVLRKTASSLTSLTVTLFKPFS